MKRPRSSKKHANPIRMPKSNGKASIVKRKKKFQFNNIFKKKKNTQIRRKKTSAKYIVIPIALILLSALVYFSVKYILFLRENAYGNKTYEINDLVGLEGIPQYPGSEYMFINESEDLIVKEFISNGNSAYKIPDGISIADIEKYYDKELKKRGWEYIQTVPLGAEDKKYGQYWLKDGKGLRIYSKFRDIWYETISEEDARTALSRIVTEEIEREMLIASSDNQDLLPDYPWRIKIPKEYLIKYFPTDIKDQRAVSFQKLGTSEIVEIYPIGTWKTKELDYMLEDYCKLKSTDEVTYSVFNSVPISFRDSLGLRATLKKNSDTVIALVIPNSFNNLVYILSTTQLDDPFFEYIIENIKPLGAKD
ncbi:MAG: hypothetical protein UR34_C0005G0023 [candidate division WS6 bacterium GW2011_GWC1_33_20]|uniref:Uncharacterized protein n=2 Tax=Candidatus Dojkabacteria TaxID=74243 RepID=A0A0G0AE83_9BACT|nr:MAG: hypothetical protein UR32_C0002G0005 [candidate division WS6 bacterium GW2011_GWE2_33_157]KKP44200.1 MAG: hypothetical protein UR34_C0005G0023 [candidate division WS6 bacterium GW2011_GWC1_33_20]KKP45744.1 MAG: hypothetical protein UR36_C0004G0005 [candidate division WS6 bacterium GW2011_GWF1_33_233]KKP55094.1 MAG: hypothetical protein UR47_C0005G0023 [candidate division WS6 bacterium GW2011_GWB1_33_6]KKP55187.1 MAG: hypothetical protein UR45_C0003G0005 [candidate division WS6 bacterium